MQFEIKSIENIAETAKAFIEATVGKNIFAFYGGMGAGKTTFIKAVCQQLGITDIINSPTFAIINEYTLPNQEPVFHFDFYRIKKTEEAYDLGYEEYFYSGYICFIEWPEMIEALLPEDCTRVHIEVQSDGKRIIKI